MTLVKLAPTGSVVHIGDLVAEFDSTAQVKSQRDAQAKFDDLSHQVESKMAEDRSNAAKRASDWRRPTGSGKSQAGNPQGPVLSDSISSRTREIARRRRTRQESGAVQPVPRCGRACGVGVLTLQRDRQKLTLAQLQRDWIS